MWYEDREPGIGFTLSATIEDPSEPAGPTVSEVSLFCPYVFLTVSPHAGLESLLPFPRTGICGQDVNKGRLLRGPCAPDRPGMPNLAVRRLFATDPRHF